jgi:hypothetical protein
VDQFGRLYDLQLTGPEKLTLLDQRWDQSAWDVEPPQTLEIDAKSWTPSSLVSAISSDGYLLASVLGDSVDLQAKSQSEIISLGQFVEPSESAPAPYTALIPAAPITAGTQTLVNNSGISTPDTPFANIDDSQPFLAKNRNVVGLLLIGGVLIFFIFIILATSRSKGKGKTNTG